MKIGVIADDFTGANDAAIRFAEHGITTASRVFGSSYIEIMPDIIIEDTESRHIEGREAHFRVHETIKRMKAEKKEKIYKKIDSTLRGNVASELKAMTDFLEENEKIVVVIPFPEVGRKVLDGKHYVNDIPLEKSDFANDPLYPMKTGDVCEILGQGKLVSIENVRNNIEDSVKKIEEKVIVFDAENENDMVIIAKFIYETGLDKYIVGSAGIIKYIAPYWKREKKILILSGSCTEKNIIQMNQFESQYKNQLHIININMEKISNPNYIEELSSGIDETKDIFIRNIVDKKDMNDILMKYEKMGKTRNEIGKIVEKVLVDFAIRLIQKYNLRDIIVAGGETSYRLVKELGVSYIMPIAEIETGIPFCVSNSMKYKIITKPGSFGTDNIYIKCYEKLKI